MTKNKFTRKLFASLLALALILTLMPISAFAAEHSGTCGSDLTWTLDTDTGVLSINGTGNMTDWNRPESSGWYYFRSSIKTIVISEGVTSVGAYAFYYCHSLTSVTIPDSVTSIEKDAFYDCGSLTSVTIGNNVTSIGDSAFYNCTILISVTLPNSVTSIGAYAFRECYALTSAYFLGDAPKSFGNYVFVSTDGDFKIYYNEGTSGWATPTWNGYPTEMLLSSCEHLTEGVITTEPTCEETGVMSFYCADCGEPLREEEVDALEHDFNVLEGHIDATCEADGHDIFKCSRCDETDTEILPATGHSYTSAVTAPTCAEQGYTTYTCDCGESYADDYITALGHDWNGGVITKEPAEYDDGEMTFTCSHCGDTRTETISALGHEHSYTPAVTAPTCAEQGYTTYTCDCGESYVDDYAAALGHDWNGGVVTKEPTEYVDGEMTYTCQHCEDTRTESITKITSSDNVKFLQSIAPDVLKNGLSSVNLVLTGKTLKLVFGDREIILSTNANNKNLSGQADLGGGYRLVFDIKGNGSNVKTFEVVLKR